MYVSINVGYVFFKIIRYIFYYLSSHGRPLVLILNAHALYITFNVS